MSKHIGLDVMVKKVVGEAFGLKKVDIGADAVLSARGAKLETESYEVEGFGHLCTLKMRAMMGMMTMETVVLSSYEKELPLLNIDWVQAMGKETLIIEYYDDRIKDFDQTLINSLKDSGKGKTDQFNQMVMKELDGFVDQMNTATPAHDKKRCVKHFAEALFQENGPAVSQIVKLFGSEIAHRLVVRHMYGMKD